MKVPIIMHNERGVALIAGLLILVILSILGITTMQSSLLQERMAGNLEQRDIAFQLAEAGLRDAEAWLRGSDELWLDTQGLDPVASANGLYQTPDSDRWENISWADANSVEGDLDNSRYYVEFMRKVDAGGSVLLQDESEMAKPWMYRITSRGVSPNARSVVVLQTTFIR